MDTAKDTFGYSFRLFPKSGYSSSVLFALVGVLFFILLQLSSVFYLETKLNYDNE